MDMNIYVGNLSYGVTEDELQQLFVEYGSVVSANLIMDRDTGNPKGFGFVEMENQADAEKAIKELDGRKRTLVSADDVSIKISIKNLLHLMHFSY